MFIQAAPIPDGLEIRAPNQRFYYATVIPSLNQGGKSLILLGRSSHSSESWHLQTSEFQARGTFCFHDGQIILHSYHTDRLNIMFTGRTWSICSVCDWHVFKVYKLLMHIISTKVTAPVKLVGQNSGHPSILCNYYRLNLKRALTNFSWIVNLPLIRKLCGLNNWGTDMTADEINLLKSSIISTSQLTMVDPRFILAIVMQESKGCARVPTTSNGVRNLGLMQGKLIFFFCLHRNRPPGKFQSSMLLHFSTKSEIELILMNYLVRLFKSRECLWTEPVVQNKVMDLLNFSILLSGITLVPVDLVETETLVNHSVKLRGPSILGVQILTRKIWIMRMVLRSVMLWMSPTDLLDGRWLQVAADEGVYRARKRKNWYFEAFPDSFDVWCVFHRSRRISDFVFDKSLLSLLNWPQRCPVLNV